MVSLYKPLPQLNEDIVPAFTNARFMDNETITFVNFRVHQENTLSIGDIDSETRIRIQKSEI
jgi:hypothetical protein